MAATRKAHVAIFVRDVTRSVEFYRKRDQLERQEDRIAVNANGDQPSDVKEQASKNDEWQHLRGNHRNRHNRHACLQGSVGFGVLDGMTGFVRSHS